MNKASNLSVLASAILVMTVGCAERPTSFTLTKNPTTEAGRGAPTLDDRTRPAAWIYVDGHKGKFVEQDGHPLLQWMIDTPVSATPTFRVEVVEEVVPPPVAFKCVLQTREAADGSFVSYGLTSEMGLFQVGTDYTLTTPGEAFVVKDLATGDVVAELDPLAPGDYLIAAALENPGRGIETPAVTFFTVGSK